MKRLLFLLFTLAPAKGLFAQSIPAPGEMEAAQQTAPPSVTDTPPPPAPTPSGHGSAAASAVAMEHLTRSNQELLDLLKQQQAVLEDIQYDRRLQNRQISLLEQRLEDTLQLNAELDVKVAKLEATASAAKSEPAPEPQAEDPAKTASPDLTVIQPPVPPAPVLPPEEAEGAPGTLWWHRILKLSGADSKTSDTFHITGKQWRVLWHNQDRPGDAYKNTSALFISAFPVNGTLPRKVCSQLGTGGDNTELTGHGDYNLKIEASGGQWDLAVEDFR